MSRSEEIIAFFADDKSYVSGNSIASRLGITRTAVWKHLRQLGQMGYTFEQRKGQGYRLKGRPDRLYPWEIAAHLKTGTFGRKVFYEDTVDSTNGRAFALAMTGAEEGTCVVAEAQNAGRGRLQRRWHSPHGKNLYLSVILKPDIHPSKVYPIAFVPSLAAYDTLTAFGLTPRLKWPNDVMIGARKVCGTLIELSTEADRVRFVIVGIGLNINMDEHETDAEIRDKATSLLIELRKPFERAAVCGMLLNNLEKFYETSMRQGMNEICLLWEKRAQTRGTSMEVRQFGRLYRGVSEGIDDDGALLLRENGRLVRVIAGDVTG